MVSDNKTRIELTAKIEILREVLKYTREGMVRYREVERMLHSHVQKLNKLLDKIDGKD